jgi:SAM-dependent methyltransferase
MQVDFEASRQNPQREHYEQIHDDYARHYYDSTSMEYRRRFIFDRLLDGIDLNGKSVADLACGDGHNSLLIRERFPTVKLQGFDISPTACESYRSLVGSPAYDCDLLGVLPTDEKFDAAIVIGGLHHLVNGLDTAMNNIARMLKPGGILLIKEPNSRYFLNSVRMLWYRKDRFFEEDTEAPLELRRLASDYSSIFQLDWSKHFGGPAYFAIYNSLVLRIPVWIKPWIARPLMALDYLYDRLPGERLFPVFLARLHRN